MLLFGVAAERVDCCSFQFCGMARSDRNDCNADMLVLLAQAVVVSGVQLWTRHVALNILRNESK